MLGSLSSLYQKTLLISALLVTSMAWHGAVEAASLRLSWGDVSNNEDGFRIERMAADGSFVQIAAVGANVTSYTDSNLTSGSTYCYVVRAFNSGGVSDPSNGACATAMDPISTVDSYKTTNSGSSSSSSGATSSASSTASSSSSSSSTPLMSSDNLDSGSTRGSVLTGDNVMIGGFVIGGDSPKTMLIRARGPALADLGVTGVLQDPFLRLFSGGTVIAQNNNWRDSQEAEIIATGLDPCQPSQVDGPAPTGCTREPAILITLDPGPYTAIVSGVSGGTGVGIVEIYEVGDSTSRLVNISSRGFVGTGDDVMIGGFIIEGDSPKTMLIQARGPALADLGVPGVLQDPSLQLFSGSTVIAQNNNWRDSQEAEIIATGLDPCQPFQAGGSAPTGCNQESAILITLDPGPYTAIVSGVSRGTGVGLVAIYELN